MLKRLGMIVVSIVCAALFAFVLPVLFTAWAAEATLYTCNSGAGVECSIEPAPTQTNTTLTTTQILTSSLPTSVTIRITTTAPIAEFDLTFAADFALGDTFTRAVAQTQTNRIALITIPITSVAVGQTQTKVLLELYSSTNDIIEGRFVIKHPFTPTVVHTGPYTVAMPLLHKIYCKPFGESCFGANDTFAQAPEIQLVSLINQTFNGTLSLPDDQRDYYRMTFTDTRPYTISINALAATPTNSDLDLYLYDGTQKTVCRSSFVGKSYERITINQKPCSSSSAFTQTTVLPGTYTLMVQYAFSGTIANNTVPYTLTINR